MEEKQKKLLEGIIVPLVTPLMSNNQLDKRGLQNLLEHTIEGGVNAIFILGTTGEAQSLSMNLRVEMIEETCKIIDNRVPFLVGISDTSLHDSLYLADKAHEVGAFAVVATAPYYFATSQTELIDYFENLTLNLKLPLFLYNMPTHTKVNFAPETIKTLAKNDKIIGFKDSSANGAYFQTVMYLMRENPDFLMFVGPEEMTAEMVLMGADGGVNGGANLYPKLYVELYQAAKFNDIQKIKQLQPKVMQISNGIYNRSDDASSYLRGLKCALSLAGLCNDFTALPYSRFEKEYRKEIEAEMVSINHALNDN